MSVRSDLETRLKNWASSPFSNEGCLEGRPFTKPTDDSTWLQPFVLPSYP